MSNQSSTKTSSNQPECNVNHGPTHDQLVSFSKHFALTEQSLQCFRLSFNSSQLQHNKMENSHRSNLFQPQTVRQPQSNEDVQCSSRNNVILPPISEHFAVSCEQMKNDNDDFLSRVDEIRVKLNALIASSGVAISPIKNDFSSGVNNPNLVTPNVAKTRSNAAKPQADSNNNIKNNFIYGNRNMINHNQQRQFISPVIKDHQTLHLGSRRRSLPLSVNRNSIYSDVGSSHHISTSSTINGSTNPLNWNHSNRNESNISSTSNGHRQVYQPEFRTIEEQQHTPPSCSSKTKTTDSPILTKGNIEDKTPVMNPNLNPISYSKSAPCNSNLFKTETDNGDSTKNQGKIDKGKYFVLSDIYWDNSTLDQAKSNSNDSTVKNVNKNPNQSLVPLQNCFLNNSVQNLFNDTEVIRREIPSSTVHETELPEFGPFCSDTSFVLAEDSNCSSGSNQSTRNSPESVSSSGSIHLASKNKDLLNHYFNHSDEGNSPPIETVNSTSLQEIMNSLISKASISSSSSVSINNSASTPEKGELSNNKDVNDNYAKEPEHKQQTYTETNAAKDSFAQVPMSMQNGSIPTAPPATTTNNSFLPTFQNALVNAAAAAAAMQQSNPHQFGQIFGINYFNSLAAQPAIMNANAHLPGHHTVPHAANPASIPQAFPFQFLASMNQAALAAAAAAVSANTSTTGHTSTNSTINSNNTAQTLAMLAATQGGNVGDFDPRFIMEQIGKDDFEVKAKDHREAASRVSECESIYSITRFDFKPPADAIYSPKVFLGGVPWDMNNDDMMEVFRPFGAESIQRPGKEVRLSRASQGLDKAGYLYLIFDSDSSVNRLIDSCKLELSENGHKYFYNLTSKRSKKEKRVQVIPWNTADSCCVLNPIAKADQSRTVFLGALHGMMNAQSIAQALSLIFGPVEYVSLDTDKFKYPMGSGQAMFATKDAYLKAVSAGFVRVKSDRFEKTIQIDQFLDDRNCFRCCYEKGLLKDYLRELPEPLFNKALFDMMDDGLSVCVPDDPTGNAKLMFSILECLSKNCRNTVLYLMDHIKLVHLNADRNKMTSQTLAICFGPLFSCHSESDSVHKAIQVFKFLLDIWPHRKGSFNFMKKLDDIKAERPHPISSDQTRIDRESNVNKPAISSIGTSVPIPNTTASRLSSETSMITVVGSKSGPIQISERNPFRGLVGSMNANTSETSDYYTPGMRNYGDHNVSSGPSSNLATMYDSPPGSRYGLTRNTTTTTTTTTSATAAVTSSTSWISNSSGSSGSGRMLPSTQSATRTISTYSNTNEISHITVPAGATGPSILNPVTSTITSYRGTASYSSSYDHTTSSGSTISTHTMSSNHPQPYQSSSLSSATYKDTSSYYRSNQMSGSPTHDTIPTSTDYSRPYYSSSSVGANPTIGSSSINNRYPLTSSSSDVPMSTTGHHTSESIYSTVNKTGKTTDLYSNDTDTFAKIGTDRYKRDPLTSENDDYLTTSATTNYRSSNYLDRSNAITSSTTTTSSSYVPWSSTSDSSGIGSKYGRNTIDDYNYTPSSRSYLHGSTGSTTYSSDSNIGTSILSSSQTITSPPTRVGEHYTSRLSSSEQSVKPLIGPYGTAGTGSTSNYSSTQVYPTKFNSSSLTSSALSSTISTTSTVGNSNNSYLYSTSLSSSNYSNSSAIGYGSNRLNSSEMTSTTSATGTNRSSYSNI